MMISVFNVLRKKKDIFFVLNFFVLSMFFQSILAIAQFFRGQSIGLSLFGEQLISAGISGVAKTIIHGEKHIRSYGTFPHPNILAFFLLVALAATSYLIANSKNRHYKIYLYILSAFILLAILFTFSRVVWIMTVVFLLATLLQGKVSVKKVANVFRSRFLSISIVFLVAAVSFGAVYFWSDIWWRINPFAVSTWDSWYDRIVVIQKTFILIKEHLVFGAGAGNFVIEIADLLIGYPLWMSEPVHNTYLLVLAEIGLGGLVSYLFVLYYIYKGAGVVPFSFKCIFWFFVFNMFFDHCFWDIRQIVYLFFFFAGLIMVFNRNKVYD